MKLKKNLYQLLEAYKANDLSLRQYLLSIEHFKKHEII